MMTTIDILLSLTGVTFLAGVSVAVWRTLPSVADTNPDMNLVRNFVASTPRKELNNILIKKE